MSLDNNETAGIQPGDVDLTAQVFGDEGSAEADQASDDAFASGYEQADDSSFEEVTPETDDAATTAEATPDVTPETPPPPTKIGRWTEDEVAEHFGKVASVEKTAQTLAGRIGDLQRRILDAGKPRQLTPADLSTVAKEFGDEFAAALAADLSKVGLGGPTVVPQDAIASVVAERQAQMEQAIEQKLEYKAVLRRHKDANDYFVRSDAEGKPVAGKHASAFRAWLGSLPVERQQEIATSWDRDVIAGAIGEFKEHQSKGATPAQASAQPQVTPAARVDRLRRAAMPRGSGGGAQVLQEDPFEAGWKAARAGG